MTYISYDPGEKDEVKCLICHSQMNVRRSVSGPTCWAEAVSGRLHFHDHFWCPNDGQHWHEKLKRLKEEIKETISEKVRSILAEEISEILREQEIK